MSEMAGGWDWHPCALLCILVYLFNLYSLTSDGICGVHKFNQSKGRKANFINAVPIGKNRKELNQLIPPIAEEWQADTRRQDYLTNKLLFNIISLV